jgi:hypothetical protein
VAGFDDSAPLTNDIVHQGIINTLQALDLAHYQFDSTTGIGWYEQMGQGLLALFSRRSRKNVLAFSPAFNAIMVQRMFTKLRTAARTEHLVPLTPSQIKQEVTSILLEFNFALFQGEYLEWQSHNAVANIHWQDVIRQDAGLQLEIQPSSAMFAVAETTGAGAAGDVPLKKKPKLVTTKGGAKAAAGTKTGTMVPATAGGAYVGGGGGAIVGGGAATTTTSTATANNTTETSRKGLQSRQTFWHGQKTTVKMMMITQNWSQQLKIGLSCLNFNVV